MFSSTLHQTEICAIYVLVPFNNISIRVADLDWEFLVGSVYHVKSLSLYIVIDHEVLNCHSNCFWWEQPVILLVYLKINFGFIIIESEPVGINF